MEQLGDADRDIETRRDPSGYRHTTLSGCARCGDDHEDLPTVLFWRPIEDHEDGFFWRWWATCPTTGDPILIRDLDES